MAVVSQCASTERSRLSRAAFERPVTFGMMPSPTTLFAMTVCTREAKAVLRTMSRATKARRCRATPASVSASAAVGRHELARPPGVAAS